MFQHIAEIDHVKPAKRRRAGVVEKTFGDGRAQRARVRRRLARWFDAMRQPAAPKRGLQKETRPASHIQQAPAIGWQKRFENLQPVGLRQLAPELVLAGMGEKT